MNIHPYFTMDIAMGQYHELTIPHAKKTIYLIYNIFLIESKMGNVTI